MRPLPTLRSTTLLVCAAFALSACKGGGGSDPVAPDIPKDPFEDLDRVGSNPIDGLPEHFSAYFVESFDLAAVRAVRKAARFAAQSIDLNPIFAGHPVYDGSTRVEGNAFEAARIDYAHSVGLTGAGQTISIIDSAIRTSHDEFTGKKISVSSGSAYKDGDNWHGTGVAAIAVGSGKHGEITGVAPKADLHSGALDFNGSITYGQLATYANEARDLGAIAMNNSWGFTDADGNARKASDHDLPSYFSSNGSFGDYIQALKEFANGKAGSAGGVIVWAAPNDYHIDSINVMNALPLVHTDLEKNWLAVINVIPEYDEQRITSGTRVSGACLEAARYCLATQGYVQTAYSEAGDSGYRHANGTSFASPQVSGGLALLAEAFPNLDATQIRDRMLVTADNGWFEQHDAVEFAPGLSHAYSEEFGHGFMDLRAALLPIGEMTFTSTSGESMEIGTPAVAGGRFSGDAVVRSLSKKSILATDGMAGDFSVGGEAIAATTQISSAGEGSLARMSYADIGYSREALTSAIRNGDNHALLGGAGRAPFESAASALGGTAVPLLDADLPVGLEAIVPTSSDGAYGIGLRRSLDFGAGALGIAVTTMRQDGSMMGIVAPGHEDAMGARTTGIELSYAAALDERSAIRLSGEFGSANGPGAGLIDGFDDVRYDSFGVSVDRRDLGIAGSALTVFARQPLALSDGTAEMTLGTGRAAGGEIMFSSMDLDLAPEARQADLGFEYTSPIGAGANMSFGVTRSLNSGNISGEHETSASIGLQIRM